MNTLELRNALGRFATGVCLITVNDEISGQLALTANSFTSVSLEPPLVLWSLQNKAECFREYTECEYFGISVLSSSQEQLSNAYARRGHHAIDPAAFTANDQGVPALRDCIAHFNCRRYALYEGGDHRIIVGEVLDFTAGEHNPLLFFRGGYDRLKSAGV